MGASDRLNTPGSGWTESSVQARRIRRGIRFPEHHAIPKELFRHGSTSQLDLFKALHTYENNSEIFEIFDPTSRKDNGAVLDIAKHKSNHIGYTDGIKNVVERVWVKGQYDALRNGSASPSQADQLWRQLAGELKENVVDKARFLMTENLVEPGRAMIVVRTATEADVVSVMSRDFTPLEARRYEVANSLGDDFLRLADQIPDIGEFADELHAYKQANGRLANLSYKEILETEGRLFSEHLASGGSDKNRRALQAGSAFFKQADDFGGESFAAIREAWDEGARHILGNEIADKLWAKGLKKAVVIGLSSGVGIALTGGEILAAELESNGGIARGLRHQWLRHVTARRGDEWRTLQMSGVRTTTVSPAYEVYSGRSLGGRKSFNYSLDISGEYEGFENQILNRLGVDSAFVYSNQDGTFTIQTAQEYDPSSLGQTFAGQIQRTNNAFDEFYEGYQNVISGTNGVIQKVVDVFSDDGQNIQINYENYSSGGDVTSVGSVSIDLNELASALPPEFQSDLSAINVDIANYDDNLGQYALELTLKNGKKAQLITSEVTGDDIADISRVRVVDGSGKVISETIRIEGDRSFSDIVGDAFEVSDLGAIGRILGSSLGRLIQSDNVLIDTASGVIVTAVALNLGQALESSNTGDVSSAYKEIDSAGKLEDAQGEAWGDFGADVSELAQGAAVGLASTYLSLELIDALGVGGEIGQVLDVAASSVIAETLSSATGIGDGVRDIFNTNTKAFQKAVQAGEISQFDYASTFSSAIASYVGVRLGQAIVTPETEAAPIIGSVASAVGSYYGWKIGAEAGFTLGGPIGGAIGSFVGYVVGTLFGNLFGKKKPKIPQADAETVLSTSSGYYYLGAINSVNGGNEDLVRDMASAARDTLNGIISLITYDSEIAGNANLTSPNQVYGHTGGQLWVKLGSASAEKQNVDTADEAVDKGALWAIRQTKIAGGDLYMKRALYNSTADSILAFSGDLQIAEDYGFYLDNRELINSIIAEPYESLGDEYQDFYAYVKNNNDLESDWQSYFKPHGMSREEFGRRHWFGELDSPLYGVAGQDDPDHQNRLTTVAAGVDKAFYDAHQDVITRITAKDSVPLSASEAAWYNANQAQVDRVIHRTQVTQFAAGWIVTLQRAAELELNQVAKSDFYGGLGGLVDSLKIRNEAGVDIEHEDIVLSHGASDGGSLSIAKDTNGNGVKDGPDLDPLLLPQLVDFHGRASFNNANPGSLLNADNATGDAALSAQGGVLPAAFKSGSGRPTSIGNDIYFRDPDLDNVDIVIDDLHRETWDVLALGGGFFSVNSFELEIDIEGGDDIFVTTGGNDKLYGRSGFDWLDGGAGHDLIYGGSEDDVLLGRAGNDTLHGESGDDYLAGGAGNDTLYAGSGNDTLVLDGADGWAAGGEGDDLYIIAENATGWLGAAFDGSSNNAINHGSDTLSFERVGWGVTAGFDQSKPSSWTNHSSWWLRHASTRYVAATGAGGEPTITVGAHKVENLTGTQFDDTLHGDHLGNTLRGLGGDDIFLGGAGNDTLEGGAGADWIDGGSGVDIASYEESDAAVWVDLTAGENFGGDAEGDTLFNFEGLRGSDFNDTFKGNSATNSLYGGDGGDWFVATAGGDTYDGGDGFDTVDYSDYTSAVTVTLARPTFGWGFGFLGYGSGLWAAAGDRYKDIEHIVGTDFNDTITGGDGHDYLQGGQGNDTLDGGEGDDTFVYNLGDGIDAIKEGVERGWDALLFGEGLTWNDIVFTRLTLGVADQYDLTIDFMGVSSSQARVQIIDNFIGEGTKGQRQSRIETLDFGGSGAVDIRDLGEIISGWDNADTIYGTEYRRGQRSDFLLGHGGDDVIYGAASASAVDGSENFLFGGRGNDTLQSSTGDDVYIFERGDGVDTIIDKGGEDRVLFGPTVAAEDVIFQVVGQDLYIGVRDLDQPELRASLVDTRVRVVGGASRYDGEHIEYVTAGGVDIDLRNLDLQAADNAVWQWVERPQSLLLSRGEATSINLNPMGYDPLQRATNFIATVPSAAHQTSGGVFTFDGTSTSGTYYISIAATAAGIGPSESTSSRTTFEIVVNDPWVWDSVPDQTSTIGSDIAPLDLNDAGHDWEGDAVTFTASGLPDGVSVVDGVISGAPSEVGVFEITLVARDAGTGQARETTMTWTVEPPGTAPYITAGALSVDETASAGAPFGVIAAQDNDPGVYGELRYYFADGDGVSAVSADGFFQIDELTGAVSAVSGALDYETQNQHDVTVVVRDNAGGAGYLEATTQVSIIVNNINEAPTSIDLSNAIIDENTDGGVVGVVSAVDPDGAQGGAFSEHVFTVDDVRFEVDAANQLRLKDGASLDFEAAPTVQITLTATDQAGAGLSLSQVFTLIVGDLVDIFNGTSAADTFIGAQGVDHIYGLGGDDVLDGGEGADILDGDVGDDTLRGGAGDDSMLGGEGSDTLFGGGGQDALYGDAGEDTLYGDAGADDLSGGDGNDALFGGAGDDILEGDAGNDVLDGGAGADALIGGEGVDTASYEAAQSSIIVDLDNLSSNAGDAAGDTFASVEIVRGSQYDDTIRGDDAGNEFHGHGGNDTLLGAGGNDVIYGGDGDDFIDAGDGLDMLDGGAGNDIMIGGAHNDLYAIDRQSGADTIRNYDPMNADDVISYADNIDYTDLWFERIGDDMVITVIGTNTVTTVEDWYLGDAVGNAYDISLFLVGQRETIDVDAEQLVVVMAQYLADYSATKPTTPTEMANILSVIGGQVDALWGFSTPPTIEPVSDVSINEDETISFSVRIYDDKVSPELLDLSVLTSDGALVDPADITFGAPDAAGNRLVTIAPKPDASGSVSITLQARDGGAGLSEQSFSLNIAPVADTPNLFTADAAGNVGDAISLTISAALSEADGSETLEVDISGVPVGATLSTGTDLGGGLWRLTLAQLTGLTLTPAAGETTDLSLTVVARATDGISTATTTNTLSIAVNGAPTDIVPTGPKAVSETAANGTVVADFNHTDPDGGSATYSLLDNAGGRFAIDGATGVLTLLDTMAVDHEAATSHDITVRVTDAGGLYRDETFTIAVTDANEAPFGITISPHAGNATASGALSLNLLEASANEDWDIGEFSATEPDANATDNTWSTPQFFFKDGDSFSTVSSDGRFKISNGRTLETNATHLSYESHPDTYNYTIAVKDAAGAYNAAHDRTLSIQLVDVNETPTDIIPTGPMSVGEHAQNGTFVADFNHVDPDGDAVTYGLSDDAGGRFEIDPTTGHLTVANAAAIDYESATSHWVSVLITDPDGLHRNEWFTIQVEDENDAPTDIIPTGAMSVSEAAGVGTLVADFNHTDPDGDLTTYSLVNNPGGAFAINASTGRLTVANASAIDYESASTHQVGVRITDPGGRSLSKNFTINILDANDAPIINSASLTVFVIHYLGGYPSITFEVNAYDMEFGDISFNNWNHTTEIPNIYYDNSSGYTFSYEFLSAANNTLVEITVTDPGGLSGHYITHALVINQWFPVVLDLDNDGVELLSLTNNEGVSFDIDGDGDLEVTGWVGADDALLALDRNADVVVNDGLEISFIQDSPGAVSDLEGLVAFDTNANNLLDAGDERWADFKVWRDANSDGVSQSNEMTSLDAAGIASISLTRNLTGQTEENVEPGENTISAYSEYTRTDGTTGQVGDAAFAYVDPSADGQSAYGGVPWFVDPWSGLTLQPTVYDEGGAGVAYSDSDTLNYGTATWRGETGVDINGTDTDGSLGWSAPGEWIEFTINVAHTGTYELTFDIASTINNLSMSGSFEKDGAVYQSGDVSFDGTGGWENYTPTPAMSFTLEAGVQVLRVSFNSHTPNLSAITLTPIDVSPPAADPNASWVWGAIADQSTESGDAASTLDLNVLGSDAEGDAATFTATGLPDGVTLSNGVLSGAPTTAGTYTVTVTATDAGSGQPTSTSFTWTVTEPAGGPAVPVFNVIEGTSGSEGLTGTSGADEIIGHGGGDQFYGLDGDDRLVIGSGGTWAEGGEGDDTYVVDGSPSWRGWFVDGGADDTVNHGDDTLSFENVDWGLVVTLDDAKPADWFGQSWFLFTHEDTRHVTAKATGGGYADIYIGAHKIENLTGTAYNDVLKADDRSNVVRGLGGDDVLYGYAGGDVLDGGAGVDRAVLSGHLGDYTFAAGPNGAVLATRTATGEVDTLQNVEEVQLDASGDVHAITSLAGPSNAAPTALFLSSADVVENVAGVIVGDLLVDDPDAGETHSFTVSDARFEVVADQLKLKAGESLDYETEPSLSVTVTATDAGGLSISETFALAVSNDASDDGQGRAYVLTEGVAEAEQLHFTDQYQVQNRTGASGGQVLSLLSGEGAVGGYFDGEAGEYDLVVNYIDQSGGATPWRVLVNDEVKAAWSGNDASGPNGAETSLQFRLALQTGDFISIDASVDGGDSGMIDNLVLLKAAGDGFIEIAGTASDETFTDASGSQSYDGGDGWDTLVLQGVADDYAFSVDDSGVGVITHALFGIDKVQNIEQLSFSGNGQSYGAFRYLGVRKGGESDDVLVGTDGSDHLQAYEGDDLITGGAGNDWIDGGAGTDRINLDGFEADYTFMDYGGGVIEATNTVTGEVDTLLSVETAWFFEEAASYSLSAILDGVAGSQPANMGLNDIPTPTFDPDASAEGAEEGGFLYPILIDLEANGLDLVSVGSSRVVFESEDGGPLLRTGWIGANDAMLVLDRDGDGVINKLSEISFINDFEGAKSDLEGLRAFDSNNDGVFGVTDDAWSHFQVWRDVNQNGVGMGSELATLDEMGIVGFDLNLTKLRNNTEGYADSVALNQTQLIMADGAHRTAYDVALRAELAHINGAPLGVAPGAWLGFSWTADGAFGVAHAATGHSGDEADLAELQQIYGGGLDAGAILPEQDFIRYVDADDSLSAPDGVAFDPNDPLTPTFGLLPLVFDLDGNGVQLIDPAQSPIIFDANGDGAEDRMGWVGGGDGFLALDRNQDGVIDPMSEIAFVGDLPGATTDLEGLRAYDTNKDGWFDGADARFGEFMIWEDANVNGFSNVGELSSLQDVGIERISLTTLPGSGHSDGPLSNNVFGLGVFQWRDGSNGFFGDVELRAYEGNALEQATDAQLRQERLAAVQDAQSELERRRQLIEARQQPAADGSIAGASSKDASYAVEPADLSQLTTDGDALRTTSPVALQKADLDVAGATAQSAGASDLAAASGQVDPSRAALESALRGQSAPDAASAINTPGAPHSARGDESERRGAGEPSQPASDLSNEDSAADNSLISLDGAQTARPGKTRNWWSRLFGRKSETTANAGEVQSLSQRLAALDAERRQVGESGASSQYLPAASGEDLAEQQKLLQAIAAFHGSSGTPVVRKSSADKGASADISRPGAWRRRSGGDLDIG